MSWLFWFRICIRNADPGAGEQFKTFSSEFNFLAGEETYPETEKSSMKFKEDNFFHNTWTFKSLDPSGPGSEIINYGY